MTINLALQSDFTVYNVSFQHRERRGAPGLVPAEELLAADDGWGRKGQFSAVCGPPWPTVFLQMASHLDTTDFGPNGLFLKEEEEDMKLGKSNPLNAMYETLKE